MSAPRHKNWERELHGRLGRLPWDHVGMARNAPGLVDTIATPSARRVLAMVEQMDEEGFGDCSNHGELEAACPKSISIESISVQRREYVRATVAKT